MFLSTVKPNLHLHSCSPIYPSISPSSSTVSHLSFLLSPSLKHDNMYKNLRLNARSRESDLEPERSSSLHLDSKPKAKTQHQKAKDQQIEDEDCGKTFPTTIPKKPRRGRRSEAAAVEDFMRDSLEQTFASIRQQNSEILKDTEHIMKEKIGGEIDSDGSGDDNDDNEGNIKGKKMVVEEDNPDWPLDADVGWGIRASEYFQQHPIRNVVGEDGVEIDWEGEIEDNWVKEINCLEWETFAFHPSPLIVLIFERYNHCNQGSKNMVRGLLSKLASKSLSLGGKWQQQQLRRLNIHEFQGAELMAKYGINVPKGVAVSSVEEVRKVVQDVFPKENELVVKSQILAGGRGLGTFKNGFKGGVHIVKADKVEETAGKMLGQTLVTKQSGPQGKVVSKVYLCEKVSLVNEMYFAITLDRTTAGPLIIACRKGGTSIEDLAEKFPDMIIKVPIDVFKGITDEDAAKAVDGLAPQVADKKESMEQVKKLYKLFCDCDCTMLEINPLAETSDNKMVAADAKLNFDDNAYFRQKEIFALRDPSQEDPREVAAAKADLNYIGLDGEIGCMVNGAGLAMATMDIIKLHGGTPANFLDVGGNASESQVVEAFKILTSDEKVKAILVNIFGGIMKCDVIASGIVNAAKHVALKVPVVVRLEGTNVDQGKRILKESGMTLITAEDLDDAAEKAVKAAAS